MEREASGLELKLPKYSCPKKHSINYARYTLRTIPPKSGEDEERIRMGLYCINCNETYEIIKLTKEN